MGVTPAERALVILWRGLTPDSRVRLIPTILKNLTADERLAVQRTIGVDPGVTAGGVASGVFQEGFSADQRPAVLAELEHLQAMLFQPKIPTRFHGRERVTAAAIMEHVVAAARRGRSRVSLTGLSHAVLPAATRAGRDWAKTFIRNGLKRMRAKIALYYQLHPTRRPQIQITEDGQIMTAW